MEGKVQRLRTPEDLTNFIKTSTLIDLKINSYDIGKKYNQLGLVIERLEQEIANREQSIPNVVPKQTPKAGQQSQPDPLEQKAKGSKGSKNDKNK